MENLAKHSLISSQISLRSYFSETWDYRQIVVFLAWRDVMVRFKQTAIGVLWVVLRPLAMAAAFSFVFHKVADLNAQGVPYLLYVLVPMLPWQFFVACVGKGTESVTSNAGMVTKIYFPRILLPMAVVLDSLIDFAISLPVLAALMVYFRIQPPLSAFLALPLILLVILAGFGLGSILAALNAAYRDFRHMVPFVLQFGLFITPIGYGTASLPKDIQGLYCMNPLVGLFESLRSAILGVPLAVPIWAVVWSTAFCISCAVGGFILFARREASFVDVI